MPDPDPAKAVGSKESVMKKRLLLTGVIVAAGLAAVIASVGGAPQAVAADIDAAKVWVAKCNKCHGDTGKADTKMGEKMAVGNMTTAEWQKKYDDVAIKKAVVVGVDKTENGVKKKMKGYKDELKPEEIDALLALIRSWAPKN